MTVDLAAREQGFDRSVGLELHRAQASEARGFGRLVGASEQRRCEGCNRAGFAEEGQFATEYGDDPRCLVKLGCKGPVVKCNVPKRGWINGVGGCPNVGGICIGCTMPGFPDKFMPFMDEPPGGKLSTKTVGLYGSMVRRLRAVTNHTLNQEPSWRADGGTGLVAASTFHAFDLDTGNAAVEVVVPAVIPVIRWPSRTCSGRSRPNMSRIFGL